MSLSRMQFENGVAEFVDQAQPVSAEAAYGLVAAYWQSVGFRPPKLSHIRDAQSITVSESHVTVTGERLMFAPMAQLDGIQAMTDGELWTPYERQIYMRLLSSNDPNRSVKALSKERPSYIFGYKLPDGSIGRQSKLQQALLESGDAVEEDGFTWVIDRSFDVRPAHELANGGRTTAELVADIKPISILESHVAINAFHKATGVDRPGVNDDRYLEIVNQVVCRANRGSLGPVAVATVAWNSSHRKIGLASKPLGVQSQDEIFVARAS